MKIAVSGASGFIGRHLLGRLSGMPGVDILALTTSDGGSDRLRQLYPGLSIAHFRPGSKEMVDVLAGMEILVHLGWATVPKTANADPVRDLELNIPPGIQCILDAASAGVRRTVFISSGGTVYGSAKYLPIDEHHELVPGTAYGITKLLMEHYLRTIAPQRGMEYVILRPSNIYGDVVPRIRPQGVIEHWLSCIARAEPLQLWGSTNVVRDYLYVADLIDVILDALVRIPSGYTLNVGSGVGTSLAELLVIMEQVTQRKIELQVSAPLLQAVETNVLDTGALRAVLGSWSSTPLFDGVDRTWAALRTMR